jgi:hypothetical protein
MLSIFNDVNFVEHAIECSQNQLVAIFHKPRLSNFVFEEHFQLDPIVEVIKVRK